MSHILLIDDNSQILKGNSVYLEKRGFTVSCADTGISALSLIKNNVYDCIVLDILLPDLDGFTICKAIRTVTDTPILFLSCLEETDDKVKGLMVGGDDYMTKPCNLKELAARIHALIRRFNNNGNANGNGNKNELFFIDHEKRIISAAGKFALLSEREFNLFMLFYRKPNQNISKEELIERIWYGNAETNTAVTLIARLRRKIEFAEDVIGKIVSGYGTGYKFLPRKSSE